ncbi:MAG: hypothetical protein ACU84H_01600 [Gammaproteobacteria bacterium]
MTTKKPNETVLDNVEEGRREFVKKLFVGTAFAAPLLASFSTEGGLIIHPPPGPGDVSNMDLFCSNQSFFPEPPTPAYRADFSMGNAIATITMDCETLLIKLNVPRKGFDEAYLTGCTDPISLDPGTNIIDNDARAIWNAMANECVSVFVSTSNFTEEATFLPVGQPDI